MATAGKCVIRPNGKRGVLDSGKAAVFNGDDECPECCEEEVEPCDVCTTTPAEFEVVIPTHTGKLGGCVDDDCGEFSGTFVVAQDPGNECVWIYDGGSSGCTGGDITLSLTITDQGASFTIDIRWVSSTFGNIVIYNQAGFTDNDCDTWSSVNVALSFSAAATCTWNTDPASVTAL